MYNGINVSGPSKETVDAARSAILDLLVTERPDHVIIEALKVFHGVCAMGDVNISNCQVTGGKE